MKYKHVLFDLDGTLVDSTEGVLESAKYTIDQLGYEKLDEDTLKSFIGPPIGDSFQKTYNIDDRKKEEMVRIFRDRYKDHDLFKAELYDGIAELLQFLKEHNVKMSVATYKRYDYARMLTKEFGIDDYCSVIEGSDFEGELTKIDIMQKCIDMQEIDKSECIMIGDTGFDGKASKILGVDFIAVTFGFGFKQPKDFCNVDNVSVLDSPYEIINFFEQL